MKKVKLAIIVIPFVIAVGLFWFFAGSYDFVPSATKNPFDVDGMNRIDLTNPQIPKDSEGRIDYDALIQLVSKPYFSKLLSERNVKHHPGDIVLMIGPRVSMYTEYSSSCGYVIADNGEDYWLKSSLDHDTLTEAKIMDTNPDPCRPNTSSCFCQAQTHMAESTLKELSYFDPVQESDVANTVLEYMTQGNQNLTPKFLIGKYNLDLGDGVTAFCGEFWGKHSFDYFQGTIRDSKVVGFGIENSLPKLCAINKDAQYFGKVLGEN
ncbi:hypothetical protein [Candidatus Nitrosotenuis chungbukensis]|uniref:hypothetical protein n=2 Tax=Candidatus Nitrosotenuis chungbukensis TaxID=1353246 RepID=UPI0005B26E6E|nr:hypothetical protein [Candidatus Nitrosotenuis chungbukensis]